MGPGFRRDDNGSFQRFFRLQPCQGASGGSNAFTGGSAPSNRSISITVSCPVQPCASFDVPVSRVSTFGLPCTHIGFSLLRSSGSYQAPVGESVNRGVEDLHTHLT